MVPEKRRVALKKMEAKTEKQRLYTYAEVGSLITCMHPNVVRYLRSFKIKEEIWVELIK